MNEDETQPLIPSQDLPEGEMPPRLLHTLLAVKTVFSGVSKKWLQEWDAWLSSDEQRPDPDSDRVFVLEQHVIAEKDPETVDHPALVDRLLFWSKSPAELGLDILQLCDWAALGFGTSDPEFRSLALEILRNLAPTKLLVSRRDGGGLQGELSPRSLLLLHCMPLISASSAPPLPASAPLSRSADVMDRSDLADHLPTDETFRGDRIS